jgi:hypothetical protein
MRFDVSTQVALKAKPAIPPFRCARRRKIHAGQIFAEATCV